MAPFQGDDRAIAGLDECLRLLGLDYVDLLLITGPCPAVTIPVYLENVRKSWPRPARRVRIRAVQLQTRSY